MAEVWKEGVSSTPPESEGGCGVDSASEQPDQILTQSGCQLLGVSRGHFLLNSLVVRGFRWGRMHAMALLGDTLTWAATLG